MWHKRGAEHRFREDLSIFRWLPLLPLSLLVLLFSFSACSSAGDESSPKVEQESSPTETQIPSSSTQSKVPEIVYEEEPVIPISIVDHLGKEIVIDSVERIIPLDGSVAEVVFALDLGENVVATDLSATWPPEADALPEIGYQRSLSAETIATFTPTILIGTEIAGPPQAIEDLRKLGYPVVIVPNEATQKGPGEKIRAVAAALGVPNRGEILASELDQQIATLSNSASNEEKPVVAALYIRGQGTQLVLGKNSATYWLIEAAGGTNVADILGIDDYVPITAESLLVAAPDAIVVPSAGLESVRGIEGLLEVGSISQTPAGLNRAIFSYDDQLLLGNGPRIGSLLQSLVNDLQSVQIARAE